jgi:hypothetical protein
MLHVARLLDCPQSIRDKKEGLGQRNITSTGLVRNLEVTSTELSKITEISLDRTSRYGCRSPLILSGQEEDFQEA